MRCMVIMYHTRFSTIPRHRYGLILADPAWVYRDKANAGSRGAGHKYRLTSDQEMAQLPVGRIAAPDCLLLMWATMPMLPNALGLMAAWGFTYKTAGFTWVKTSKHGKEFIGMGRWTRANAEIVLLGTRGKPSRVSAAVRSVLVAPVGPHSQKPKIIAQRAVELVGEGIPRIELFARGDAADGWDRWGDTPVYPA